MDDWCILILFRSVERLRVQAQKFKFELCFCWLNLLAGSKCILEKLFPSNSVFMELTVDVTSVSWGDIWCISISKYKI